MKANLDIQRIIFKKQNNETKKNTKATYIVSYLIAKTMKPFTEIEFVDECMSVVREFTQKRKVFLKKLFSQQE